MILCGPNAEQCEMIQYNSELLNFYLNNGINVMVFNYRGYGLSEGTPSVWKIKQDAETVALYVRQRVGQNAKIGVHGRSIGGVVASHLARKGLVNFLFADRTFMSLNEVASAMLGTWAGYGLPILTGWFNTDVTSDYVFSSCYKVLGAANNDEIIPEAASLKTGVAKMIIQNELKTRLMEQAFKLRQSTSDVQPKLVLPKMRFETQARAITHYYHILNSQETSILFKNLDEIFSKIFELELHK
jgi:hypothetical protein